MVDNNFAERATFALGKTSKNSTVDQHGALYKIHGKLAMQDGSAKGIAKFRIATCSC